MRIIGFTKGNFQGFDWCKIYCTYEKQNNDNNYGLCSASYKLDLKNVDLKTVRDCIDNHLDVEFYFTSGQPEQQKVVAIIEL